MLMSYVVRRGAIYRWRRAVPEDLREVIGKREIVHSLRTSDPREAKRLAHAISAKVEQMFREARAALVSPAAADFKAAQEILSKSLHEQESIGYHLTMKAEDGDKRAASILRSLDTTTGNGAAPPLSLLLDRWLAAKKPPAKTVIEWRRCIKILRDLVGDLPVASLTKQRLREYQRHLSTMPGPHRDHAVVRVPGEDARGCAVGAELRGGLG
jgi:hypothetical protein